MVLAMSRPHKDSRGVYWVRRKVPTELQPILRRTEYKRSLGTRDPEEAARRFPAAYQDSVECFALARAQLAGYSLLNAADAQQLASRWFNQEHAKMLRTGDYSPYLIKGSPQKDPETGEDVGPIWESLRSVLTDLSTEKWAGAVRPFVESTLSAHQLPMPPERSSLLDQLLEAFRAKLLLLSDWAYSAVFANGRYIAPPQVEPHAPLSAEIAKQEAQTAAAQLPISKALEAWAEAKRLDDGEDRSTLKTIAEFSTVITRFIELHGDLPVTSITRATCQAFRAALAKMPTSGRGIAAGSIDPALTGKAAEVALLDYWNENPAQETWRLARRDGTSERKDSRWQEKKAAREIAQLLANIAGAYGPEVAKKAMSEVGFHLHNLKATEGMDKLQRAFSVSPQPLPSDDEATLSAEELEDFLAWQRTQAFDYQPPSLYNEADHLDASSDF